MPVMVRFGVLQRLTSRITGFDPPERLSVPDGTDMVDVFDYTSPLGPLGRLADGLFLRRYMARLLRDRNAYLKRAAESAPPG
jgi:hypothetical protein